MISVLKRIRETTFGLVYKNQPKEDRETPPPEQPHELPPSPQANDDIANSCFLIRLPIITALALGSFAPSIPAQSSFAIVAHKGQKTDQVVVARAIYEQNTFKIVSMWAVQDTTIEKVPFNGLPVLRLTVPTMSGISETQYWVFESEFDLATFVSRAPLKVPVNALPVPAKDSANLKKKKTGVARFSFYNRRQSVISAKSQFTDVGSDKQSKLSRERLNLV